MNNQLIVSAFCKPVLLAVCLLLVVPAMGALREGPVVVPENGYDNGMSYGSGWDCLFGYEEKGEACEAIVVPANGYLNSRGSGWLCERGYRSRGFDDKQCQKIEVPAGGYLTESNSGAGWTCARGFRAVSNRCNRIQVPDNAYLTNSSRDSGWECERGYRAGNESCEAIPVPPNAFLVDQNYGPGWQCERGYSTANDTTCSKLDLPENGHLGRSGNDWQCNKPYIKRATSCVKS
jgi:hypothetical protein